MLVSLWIILALSGLLYLLVKPRSMARIFFIALMAGSTFAAIALMAAWQHNPQGEFHSPEEINWAPWLGVGIGWLIAVSAVFGVLGWLRASFGSAQGLAPAKKAPFQTPPHRPPE